MAVSACMHMSILSPLRLNTMAYLEQSAVSLFFMSALVKIALIPHVIFILHGNIKNGGA